MRPIPKAAMSQSRLRLEIRTAAGVRSAFSLEYLDPEPDVALCAVRLHKDDGSHYDIHKDKHGVLHCSCADGTFRPDRPGGCKHLRELRRHLRRLSQLTAMLGCPTGSAPATVA